MSPSLGAKAQHVRQAKQTRPHQCHWPGCEKPVPPAKWGCKAHWFKLPKAIRDAIWRAYRPGQEEDGKPSPDYIKAAMDAEDFALRYEGQKPRDLFK